MVIIDSLLMQSVIYCAACFHSPLIIHSFYLFHHPIVLLSTLRGYIGGIPLPFFVLMTCTQCAVSIYTGVTHFLPSWLECHAVPVEVFLYGTAFIYLFLKWHSTESQLFQLKIHSFLPRQRNMTNLSIFSFNPALLCLIRSASDAFCHLEVQWCV